MKILFFFFFGRVLSHLWDNYISGVSASSINMSLYFWLKILQIAVYYCLVSSTVPTLENSFKPDHEFSRVELNGPHFPNEFKTIILIPLGNFHADSPWQIQVKNEHSIPDVLVCLSLRVGMLSRAWGKFMKLLCS